MSLFRSRKEPKTEHLLDVTEEIGDAQRRDVAFSYDGTKAIKAQLVHKHAHLRAHTYMHTQTHVHSLISREVHHGDSHMVSGNTLVE